jgi:hypothetical protein
VSHSISRLLERLDTENGHVGSHPYLHSGVTVKTLNTQTLNIQLLWMAITGILLLTEAEKVMLS